MFYRVTRYEYPQERYDEILEWANPKTEALRWIDGLRFVDTIQSGPREWTYGLVVRRGRDG